MKGMFPICIEGNPPFIARKQSFFPKVRPKAQQGIFKPCPVIQSFQRKTNSAHLSRREARNHPPPHYKSLGRGRMRVLQKGSPSLPQLSFPYFHSPKSSRHSKPASRLGRFGNKMRLTDTDAEPGKPLVGDAAGIAGLVLVHKKPVERLPRRAAVGSETQQSTPPDPAP